MFMVHVSTSRPVTTGMPFCDVLIAFVFFSLLPAVIFSRTFDFPGAVIETILASRIKIIRHSSFAMFFLVSVASGGRRLQTSTCGSRSGVRLAHPSSTSLPPS
ncbi:hypothetical protein IW262DRAFT_1412069 [Armillaria fumosa]|nr:hypothetical protein IW262DRAFT_1412069 [Armillaria fumosa]